MIPGKKIQNFITFQTKDTIFLKQNQPEFIVHEQTIQTDSFKQLLSTKRSKHKNHHSHNLFKSEKENRELNEPHKNNQQPRKSNITSSNSKNTSKERSHSNKYKSRLPNDKSKNKIREFDPNERDNTKRSKSNKQKMSKNTKSMVRLPKFGQKNLIEEDKSKNCRKSYSPNRNYSEGLKRTNPNNYSTQCIKTTKFTESKDTTTKQHIKPVKIQKNSKKESNEQKQKNTKSKQKLKSHFASVRNLNQGKNIDTQRRKQEVFSKIDVDKNKKLAKKVSPPKKVQQNKKKHQEKGGKPTKEKQLPKKRKSLSKGKKKIHFQSVDDMLLRQQNYETTRNQTTGLSNYPSQRDSFKKKIKTDRDSFNPKQKRKTGSTSKEKDKEVIVSSKNMKRIRNEAAIKIQKVYKGYITRKWLREYLRTLYAVVIIQKHWRGYSTRKKVHKMIAELKAKKLLQKSHRNVRIDPILEIQQEKSKQASFQESKINLDKWKDILFEVMGQKTVNEALKSKIKHFLETQNESGRTSFVSQRSQRSRNSEQKLQEQMMSERRYFEKRQKQQKLSSSQKKHQKYKSQDSFSIIQENDMMNLQSPSSKKSFIKESQLMSPQSLPISPKLRKSHSPQQIISNLHEIESIQKRNIILDAQSQKKELQEMLQKSVCSPRTFHLKEKQIEQKMEENLRNFQQNIKGVIQSCKDTSHLGVKIIESGSFEEDSIVMTPEHSSVRQSLVREDFENLSENQVMSKLFQKVEQNNGEDFISEESKQKQIEFKNAKSVKIEVSPNKEQEEDREVPTYENFETFNINALSQEKSEAPKVELVVEKIRTIDTSCHFLDEYLLTMIEYLRNKNDGEVMMEIVKGVKTWKNLEPYVVLRNLSVVNDQNNNTEDDGFSLPLYKYLEDDSQIIKSDYVMDYNRYFNMMKNSHKFQNRHSRSKSLEQERINEPYEHYLKLLVDSFNQALNLKRPSKYMFTDRSIQSYNNKIIVQRDETDIQHEYDMYCAGAMQEIFTWLNIKYGCRVSVDQEETSLEQVAIQDAERLKVMIKMEAERKWDEYYEKIETLAKIAEEIFEDLIIKETITIFNIERKFMKQRELLR